MIKIIASTELRSQAKLFFGRSDLSRSEYGNHTETLEEGKCRVEGEEGQQEGGGQGRYTCSSTASRAVQ